MGTSTLLRQSTIDRANGIVDTRPITMFLYLRISNDPEGREAGVERQGDDLTRLVGRTLGMHLSDRLAEGFHRLPGGDVHVFVENDTSASTLCDTPRPKYDRMLELARDAAGSRDYREVIIAAWSDSRVTRRPRENEDLIVLGERHGVVFRYVKSPTYDLNTADGREAARQAAARNAGDAERTSERVISQKVQSATEGEFYGGPAAFGFRLEHHYKPNGMPIIPGYLVIDEHQAALIREAVDTFLAGESLASIADRWTAAGVPTSQGGAEWNAVSVRGILGNARNAGLSERYGVVMGRGHWGKPVDENDPDGPWCAIITEDELTAVRAKLNDPARKTNDGGYERRWLGPGLYQCGQPDCESKMRSTGKSGKDGKPRYCCRAHGHCVINDALAVDAHVRGVICAYLVEHGASLLAGGKQADERARLIKKRTTLRGKINALVDAFSGDDEDDAQAFRDATRKLKARIAEIDKAEALLIVPASVLKGVADADDPALAFLDATLERQRAIVDMLVTVTIKPGRRGRQPAGSKTTDRVQIVPRGSVD